MPVTPTYPGVYIQEIPSGVRTITGVATSITAFIGRAQRGPVNEAIVINSFADYERIFGGLWDQSSLSFTVRDYYLNGGRQAVIVRLYHPPDIDDAKSDVALQTAIALAQAAQKALALEVAGAAKGKFSELYSANEASKQEALPKYQKILYRTAAETVVNRANAAAETDPTTPQKVIDAAKSTLEFSEDETKQIEHTLEEIYTLIKTIVSSADYFVARAARTELDMITGAKKTPATELQAMIDAAETEAAKRGGADIPSLSVFKAIVVKAGETPSDNAKRIIKVAADAVVIMAKSVADQAKERADEIGENPSYTDAAKAAAQAIANAALTVANPEVATEAQPEAPPADPSAPPSPTPEAVEAAAKVVFDLKGTGFIKMWKEGAAAIATEAERAAKVLAVLPPGSDTATDAKRIENGKNEAINRMTALAETHLGKETAQVAEDALKAIKTEIEKEAKNEKGTSILGLSAAIDIGLSKAVPIIYTKAPLDINGLKLEAASEGAWGSNLQIHISDDVYPKGEDLFNLIVHDKITGQVEQFRNLSVDPLHVRAVDQVLNHRSQLVRVKGGLPSAPPKAHPVPGPGKGIWEDPNCYTGVPETIRVSDGSELNQNDFTGQGFQAEKKGLYALEQVDLFNLLCLPPYTASSDVEPSLVDQASSYCEQRRAILLVDAPSGWTNKDAARKGIDGEWPIAKSKNAAIFFPRLRQPNPLRDNRMEDFAPCGAVAGVMSRTDVQRGVWKAPAGLEANLVGVPYLSVSLTDAENGELNPLGLNCLRARPAAGRVVWGSRTLLGDDRLASEWKYIPVRRLALYIEESLYRGIQWAVFEPNDEPLWAQLRLNIGSFMHNLFRQGAFQGQTPRQAYFVKCDKEITTQNDIDLGIVNIVVGFAPLKPAEFVIVKLQQIAGQLQV